MNIGYDSDTNTFDQGIKAAKTLTLTG